MDPKEGMIEWYVATHRWGLDPLIVRPLAGTRVRYVDPLGRLVNGHRELSDLQCCWLVKYGHSLSRTTPVYVTLK